MYAIKLLLEKTTPETHFSLWVVNVLSTYFNHLFRSNCFDGCCIVTPWFIILGKAKKTKKNGKRLYEFIYIDGC
jgi:hypothetical protein